VRLHPYGFMDAIGKTKTGIYEYFLNIIKFNFKISSVLCIVLYVPCSVRLTTMRNFISHVQTKCIRQVKALKPYFSYYSNVLLSSCET
jgi:hypothetical protein